VPPIYCRECGRRARALDDQQSEKIAKREKEIEHISQNIRREELKLRAALVTVAKKTSTEIS